MKGQETYGDMEEKQSSREGILDPSENKWSEDQGEDLCQDYLKRISLDAPLC